MANSKIKQISFKKDETFIGFVSSESLSDSTKIANDKAAVKSDLPRHSDFEYRMQNLCPHLLIALGVMKPTDYNGNYLQMVHFKDQFWNDEEEAERFGGLTVTGVLVQGKHAADGVQIFGYRTTTWGQYPLKTPTIPLTDSGTGEAYPLRLILDEQLDILMREGELYKDKKKHGAGVQTEAQLPPVKPDANTKNRPAAAKAAADAKKETPANVTDKFVKSESEQNNLMEV